MDESLPLRGEFDNAEVASAGGEGWNLWEWASFIRKRVGAATYKIAAALLKFVSSRTGEAWPSMATLAQEAGVSPRTAQRGMADLEERGFALVVRHATHHSTKRWRISYGRGDTSDVSKVTRQKRRPKAGVTVLTRRGDSFDVVGRQFCHPELSKELKREPQKKSRAGALDALEGFEGFWKAYAHKVNRKAAEKAWRKAIKSKSADEIAAAAGKYAATRNPNFIAHASTWLNGERWNDEPTQTGLNHDEQRHKVSAARGGQSAGAISAIAAFNRKSGGVGRINGQVAFGGSEGAIAHGGGPTLEGEIVGGT